MMHCEICKEEVNKLYKHHVTPKSKGGRHGDIAKCCRTCANQVHLLFNEKELAAMSLEELISTEKMHRYIKWKNTHPGEHRGRVSQNVKKWKRYHR